MSPSGASSRSTIAGAGSLGPLPLQRRRPGELVLVVIGAGDAPFRDVRGDPADPAARRGHGARLWMGEAGSAGETNDDVVQAHPREHRPPIPRGLAVECHGVATVRK